MPNFQCKRCNSKFSTEQSLNSCPVCESRNRAETIQSAVQAKKKLEAFANQQFRRATEGFGRSNTAFSCLLAGILLVPFFPAVWLLRGTYVGSLFSGWVPMPITFLALAAILSLMMKTFTVRRQRKAFALDLLPISISPTITPQNVNAFRHNLANIKAPKGSIAVALVDRMLEFFSQRPNTSRTESYVQDQIDGQSQAIEDSYSTINLIIWCLPILGFIGTVIGIGGAVGGFAGTVNAADDLQIIKESLGDVTSSLAYSFNTTLLALLMSILVIFPKSYVKRQEARILLELEATLRDVVALRLRGLDSDSPNARLDLIQQHHQIAKLQSEAWAQQCEQMGRELYGAVQTALQSEMQRMVESCTKLTIQNETLAKQIAQHQNEFGSQFSTAARSLNQSVHTGFAQLTEASTKLDQQLRATGPMQAANSESLARMLEVQQRFLNAAGPQVAALQDSTKTLTDNLLHAADRLAHVEQLEIPQDLVTTIHCTLENSKRLGESLTKLEQRVSASPPPIQANTEARRRWNLFNVTAKSET